MLDPISDKLLGSSAFISPSKLQLGARWAVVFIGGKLRLGVASIRGDRRLVDPSRGWASSDVFDSGDDRIVITSWFQGAPPVERGRFGHRVLDGAGNATAISPSFRARSAHFARCASTALRVRGALFWLSLIGLLGDVGIFPRFISTPGTAWTRRGAVSAEGSHARQTEGRTCVSDSGVGPFFAPEGGGISRGVAKRNQRYHDRKGSSRPAGTPTKLAHLQEGRCLQRPTGRVSRHVFRVRLATRRLISAAPRR